MSGCPSKYEEGRGWVVQCELSALRAELATERKKVRVLTSDKLSLIQAKHTVESELTAMTEARDRWMAHSDSNARLSTQYATELAATKTALVLADEATDAAQRIADGLQKNLAATKGREARLREALTRAFPTLEADLEDLKDKVADWPTAVDGPVALAFTEETVRLARAALTEKPESGGGGG